MSIGVSLLSDTKTAPSMVKFPADQVLIKRLPVISRLDMVKPVESIAVIAFVAAPVITSTCPLAPENILIPVPTELTKSMLAISEFPPDKDNPYPTRLNSPLSKSKSPDDFTPPLILSKSIFVNERVPVFLTAS